GSSGSGGSASGGLAWTGASVLLPMVAGLLALSLGALLLIGGRRRRPQDDR
ncbi:MAG: hypothetical protein QOE97_81, partial [Pseudonocardiales bacterium]|nr:hypothetical protein [Pseudonocardiales bacterium]